MSAVAVLAGAFLINGVLSRPAAAADAIVAYRLQPGDVLHVSVWREPDMQLDVVVQPDGVISLPLAGEMVARGKTIPALREEIAQRLGKLMPDSPVTLAAKQLLGNKIYVIGKVNRPGEYVINQAVDVMQALSLAQGATRFAALDDIKILRRTEDGQQAIEFDYTAVETGESLEQNIVLQSGDVVVVP
jgi:polysaccharide export outer membrane protein